MTPFKVLLHRKGRTQDETRKSLDRNTSREKMKEAGRTIAVRKKDEKVLLLCIRQQDQDAKTIRQSKSSIPLSGLDEGTEVIAASLLSVPDSLTTQDLPKFET